MRRIEQKVGETYLMALRCVEYRIPKPGDLRTPAYLLSVARRYGLVGAAATHHLLLDARDEDEMQDVLDSAGCFPDMVEEHLVQFVERKLPVLMVPEAPYMIGRIAYRPLSVAIASFDQFIPIDVSLRRMSINFGRENRRAMYVGTPLLRRRRTLAEFQLVAEKSLFYALNFFERRQADLEEVAQIAMIGD